MKSPKRDTSKRNLERTTLNAPLDGIVNEVFIEEGDYVNVIVDEIIGKSEIVALQRDPDMDFNSAALFLYGGG